MLGYGSQGRAIALNLRDSGYNVIIGLKSRSRSRIQARQDGFRQVFTARQAIQKADHIILALPDHLHSRIYKAEIQKFLDRGKTLVFLHGLSIHFGLIVPPKDCDVIMIAPHAPGIKVREKYLTDRSLSAFYAVYQDGSGQARRKAFALAEAIGFRRSRLVPSSFEDEAIGDLFGEQAVLCGGLPELILNGFEVLVEKGLPPEQAYLEVAYQLDLIIHLIKQYGIEGMYKRISVTARYGSALAGRKIVDASVKNRMRLLYDQIKSGKFAGKLDRLLASDIRDIRRAIKKRVPASFEKSARKYSK
ncbi:MAG: ketol-acid reductoisomerase [Candidatus Zixiibacteriota bacterium]|nr:MAG: ketol-acid reductoisomerase [candidate division Zixibacteria bacterium]